MEKEKRASHLSSLQKEQDDLVHTLNEHTRERAKLEKEITKIDTEIIQCRLNLEKKTEEIRRFKDNQPGAERFP